ncbi:hypothetical protein MCOR27_007069 [Pyricularia oryzae]|nr:lactate 2-monooxygenase [Pyricularia oryzae Y34]KAI6256691.1 hypothetical protein MCOR19_006875 [Pyricularia oryzae]KAI6275209.1 hypothetical protein MCOR27_007069 [Pyricularia oryzae]KAI6341810.1 hypothetical protein MCOR30_002047 [Pyricularia oryzae]KAI6364064.1 hypothetical protein MCOR32_008020 [Pyricularia oryzae]
MAGDNPINNFKQGGGGGDPSAPQPQRTPYSEYQLDIYRARLLEGRAPPATTDPRGLEQQAREHMSPEGFGYVAGGAGAEETVTANRVAFGNWRLVPRLLRPTAPRDLGVKLFGTRYDNPLVMAPVGVQEAYHEDRELGTARACAELGVPFCVSTAASSTVEEIAEASSGSSAGLWYQLYWPLDDEITASLLGRARRAGCRVLLVTLDTHSMSWRPRDLDRGFIPFAVGSGNAMGFSDPVFRRKFAAQVNEGGEEDEDLATPEGNPIAASLAWTAEVFSGYAHRWTELAKLRRMWGEGNPIVLKGILSVEDARLALEYGMDGIVVSNHGGRQLDGAIAALDVLPEIVDAVGGNMTVLFDSGVRSGADVIKALCLGAKGVLVGRPVIYGLGIAGKEGAQHVLASILADLDQSMGLAGVNNIGELTRDRLRRAPTLKSLF